MRRLVEASLTIRRAELVPTLPIALHIKLEPREEIISQAGIAKAGQRAMAPSPARCMRGLAGIPKRSFRCFASI